MSEHSSGVSRKLFCNSDKLFYDNFKNLDDRLNLNNNFNENKYEEIYHKKYMRNNRRFKTEPPKNLYENEGDQSYSSFFHNILRSISKNIRNDDNDNDDDDDNNNDNDYDNNIDDNNNNNNSNNYDDTNTCCEISPCDGISKKMRSIHNKIHKDQPGGYYKNFLYNNKNLSKEKKINNICSSINKTQRTLKRIDTNINQTSNSMKYLKTVNSDIISDVFLKNNVKSLIVYDTGGIDIELIENENPEFLYHTYTGNIISNMYYEYDDSIKNKDTYKNEEKKDTINSSLSYRENYIFKRDYKLSYSYKNKDDNEKIKNNSSEKNNIMNNSSDMSSNSDSSKILTNKKKENNINKNNNIYYNNQCDGNILYNDVNNNKINYNKSSVDNKYLCKDTCENTYKNISNKYDLQDYNTNSSTEKYYNIKNKNSLVNKNNKYIHNTSSERSKGYRSYSSISSIVSLNAYEKENRKKYYYIGETMNNIRNGWGMLIYNDRVIFEGEYKMNNAIGYFIKYNEYSTEIGYRSPISVKSVIIMSDNDNFIVQNRSENLDTSKSGNDQDGSDNWNIYNVDDDNNNDNNDSINNNDNIYNDDSINNNDHNIYNKHDYIYNNHNNDINWNNNKENPSSNKIDQINKNTCKINYNENINNLNINIPIYDNYSNPISNPSYHINLKCASKSLQNKDNKMLSKHSKEENNCCINNDIIKNIKFSENTEEDEKKLKKFNNLTSYIRRNSKHKTSPARSINYLKPPVMNLIRNNIYFNRNAFCNNDSTCISTSNLHSSTKKKREHKTTHFLSPMNIIITSLDTDDEDNISDDNVKTDVINGCTQYEDERKKYELNIKTDEEQSIETNIKDNDSRVLYQLKINKNNDRTNVSDIEKRDFKEYEEIYDNEEIKTDYSHNDNNIDNVKKVKSINIHDVNNKIYNENDMNNLDNPNNYNEHNNTFEKYINKKKGEEESTLNDDQNKLYINAFEKYKYLICENINNDNFVIKNNQITTFEKFIKNEEKFEINNKWRDTLNKIRKENHNMRQTMQPKINNYGLGKYICSNNIEQIKKDNILNNTLLMGKIIKIKNEKNDIYNNIYNNNIYNNINSDNNNNNNNNNICSEYLNNNDKENIKFCNWDRNIFPTRLRGATFPETHDDRQKHCFLFIDDYLTSNENKFDIINENVKLRASDYNKWSVNMLYNFLKMIGLKKEAYLFKINKIRGYHILKLTDKELKKLNINNSYVRKFVLSVFRFLTNSIDNADPLSLNFNSNKKFSFNNIQNICNTQITILNKIGGGSYAQVFRAKYKTINVACKIFLYKPKHLSDENYCESYISTPRSSHRYIFPKINKNIYVQNYKITDINKEKQNNENIITNNIHMNESNYIDHVSNVDDMNYIEEENQIENNNNNNNNKFKNKKNNDINNSLDTLQRNKKIKKMANLEIFRYFPTPVKYRNYEAKILYSLQECKHVIKLIGVCSLKEGEESLILQYCAGGSLEKYIYKDEKKKNSAYTKSLTRPKLVKIFQQVAEGMYNIHTNQCFHRDLKLSNILLDEYQNAVISDFGLSTNFSSNDSPTAYAIYGNIFYAAPEVLKGEGFFKESDVWSFAVSLWEALTKKIAYDGISASEVFCKISSGELFLPIPKDIPIELSQLLKSMLDYDFTKRPLFNVIAKKLEQIRIQAEDKLHLDIMSFFDG
ncbi:tyrosine kinase-like protein [Plasmodium sp. DRC-Itaito]|nr:tyrosine kinase-like protein [Plasmodium sp. DRC-Itaito]